MKDAEKKLRELVDEELENTENETAAVFRLLNILEPSELAEMGHVDALREYLKEYSGELNDEEADEIKRIVYPEKFQKQKYRFSVEAYFVKEIEVEAESEDEAYEKAESMACEVTYGPEDESVCDREILLLDGQTKEEMGMSMERPFDKEAVSFRLSIIELAGKPDALDNLENYLSYHFAEWLEKYANTPENMAAELHRFATMYDIE